MKAESRYEFCLFMNPFLHHHHLFFIFIFNNITDYTAEILGNLYNTTDQKFEVMGIMYLKNYRYSFTMKVTFFFFSLYVLLWNQSIKPNINRNNLKLLRYLLT
jgi:hypothetical protein